MSLTFGSFAVLAVALLGAAPPAGDLVFDQTATTFVDGKPGATVRSRVYWSGRKVRLESGDAFDPLVLLLDLEHDRAWRLDTAARSAELVDVEDLRARSHLGFAMAGDQLGAGEADAVRTQELPGPRSIAGHPCRGHRLRAGATRLDVWLAQGVPIDMEAFDEFLDWSGAAAGLGGLLPAIRELGGFPMETRAHLTVGGRVYETRATVTRLELQKLDSALFEVPPSFAVEAEADTAPVP